MVSFRDYVLSTATRFAQPSPPVVIDPSEEVNFVDVAQALASESPLPHVFESPAEAIQSLRKNRFTLTESLTNKVCGKIRERNRSHIVYAWKPIIRRRGDQNVAGEVVLHVLHATKGWRPVHGWAV